MRSHVYRRIAAVAGAALVCAGLAPASPAAAVTEREWRTPLTQSSVQTDLVAASGRSILVFAGTGYRLSTDFGATWQVVTPALSGASGVDHPDYVADGVAAFRVWPGKAEVVDLTSGTSRAVDLSATSLDGAGDPYVALTDSHVLLRDGDQVVLSPLPADLVAGTPVAPAWADLPAAPARTRTVTDTWTVDDGFAYHVRSYGARGWVGLATDVDPVNLDGAAGPAPFRVTGDLLTYRPLDAGHLEYVSRDRSALRRCVRDLVAGTSACRTIARPAPTARVFAERMAGTLVVTIGTRVLTCADGPGCRLARVRLPRGLTVQSTAHPIGDPVEPLLSGGGPLYSVTASGALVKRSGALTAPKVPSLLGLTATRLVGMDDRVGSRAGLTAWQRPVTTTAGIGTESVIGTGVTDVAASAARVATNGRDGLALYDAGRRSAHARTTGSLGTLSGPYPLVSTSSATWVGAPLASLKRLAGTVRDNFGTRLLGTSADGSRLVITDLADAGYRREVPLPDAAANTYLVDAQLWGDWVGVTSLTYATSDDDFDVSLSARVLDLGTSGASWSAPVPGALTELGDGLAVVCDLGAADYSASAWNLVTGQLTRLTGAARHSYPSVDSGRVAYATDSDLVVREISGTGTSAPRVLGVVAASGCNAWDCAWSPQIDVTKALAAGQLLIRDASGAEARTLRTPDSPDGSLRGIAWDGRLDDGSYAPAGTYTWELVAAAADGSGAVVGVDGGSVPGGTITVTRRGLGTLSLGPVRISDTTPTVGQVVQAAARVRQSDAQLTYTWYAGTTVVGTGSGADHASYVVQPTDAGQRLRVVVSAQRDGFTPGTRSSGKTKPVATA